MNRFYHIDFIRAISIAGFIAIHVLSYNLISSINTFVWNWLHFVVGGFVFCSGYVLGKYQETLRFRSGQAIIKKQSVLDWYKKRILRLLIPYYFFLISYIFLLFLFPHYFSGLGLTTSFSSVLKSALFLEGGTNFSWLPLLFLELTIVFPLLSFLSRKKLLNWYIFFSFLITLFFSVFSFPYVFYRLVMWIPWSLVFILGIEFYKREQKLFSRKRYSNLAFISGIIFFECFVLWNRFHKPMNLIDNKYPPNLYDLSYEIFGTAILALLARGGSIYTFLSRYSYSIFFVHIIILDFVLHIQKKLTMNVLFEFLFVFFLSVFIAYLLNKLKVLYTGKR